MITSLRIPSVRNYMHQNFFTLFQLSFENEEILTEHMRM